LLSSNSEEILGCNGHRKEDTEEIMRLTIPKYVVHIDRYQLQLFNHPGALLPFHLVPGIMKTELVVSG
jgi:hypothetical protein